MTNELKQWLDLKCPTTEMAFARSLDITRCDLSNIKNGRRPVSYELAVKIQAATNGEVSWSRIMEISRSHVKAPCA